MKLEKKETHGLEINAGDGEGKCRSIDFCQGSRRVT